MWAAREVIFSVRKTAENNNVSLIKDLVTMRGSLPKPLKLLLCFLQTFQCFLAQLIIVRIVDDPLEKVVYLCLAEAAGVDHIKVIGLQNLNVRHFVGEQVYFTSVASGEMRK